MTTSPPPVEANTHTSSATRQLLLGSCTSDRRRTMAQYRASESKREQFRRYLEKSGVLDTMTSVLVALYEEVDKPDNGLDFIKLQLGAASPEPADSEALRMELADLQQKCNILMGENKDLRNRLMQYEPSSEEASAE